MTTDFDDFVEQRIHKIRNVIELDFSDMDDDSVPTGISFLRGDLAVIALPTIADNVMSVDIVGFVDGRLSKKHSMTIRE